MVVRRRRVSGSGSAKVGLFFPAPLVRDTVLSPVFSVLVVLLRDTCFWEPLDGRYFEPPAKRRLSSAACSVAVWDEERLCCDVRYVGFDETGRRNVAREFGVVGSSCSAVIGCSDVGRLLEVSGLRSVRRKPLFGPWAFSALPARGWPGWSYCRPCGSGDPINESRNLSNRCINDGVLLIGDADWLCARVVETEQATTRAVINAIRLDIVLKS
jgi:hypothetical protein